jgi:hypothetical protein
MKKIFFLLITLSASLLTYSQVYKSGPITSPETWIGTVYLTDDVTITSTVTINAGTKVLFKENDITLLVDDSGSMSRMVHLKMRYIFLQIMMKMVIMEKMHQITLKGILGTRFKV